MSTVLKELKALDRETEAEVYYAGKTVRNILRNRKSKEIDIVVRGIPLNQLFKLIKSKGCKAKKSKGHLTAKEGNQRITIRLPIKHGIADPSNNLKDDAKERVFTICSMYLPIRTRNRDNILDFYNGRDAIKKHLIEKIGKADRIFAERPMAMLQAVALAAELNYRVDNNLYYAIRAHHKSIEKVPLYEVRDEIINILLSSRPSKYLRILQNSGLLSIIMPELSICDGVTQNKKYHKHDVFTHCVIACDHTPAKLELRLAALLHDVGKPQTREEITKNGVNRVTFYNHEVVGARLARKLLRRLRFSPEVVKEVGKLVYNHMYNFEPEKWTSSAINRFVKKVDLTEEDIKNISDFPLFQVRKADRAASGQNLSQVSRRQRIFERKLVEAWRNLSQLDLEINGHIIMETFNLKPGPTVGHVLHYLKSLVEKKPEMNDRSILLEEASKYLSSALK